MAFGDEVQAFVPIVEGDDSVTPSYASQPTQDSLLIATANSNGSIIGNATMPAGWNLAVSVLQGTTSTIGIWYKIAGASEPSSVTLTWTSSTVTRMAIGEFEGPWNPTPLDQIASAANSGSVTSKSSGTTPATTVADELCVAAVGVGNTVTAQSWSNSFSARVNIESVLNAATKVLTVTGAQESTMSWTTARVAGGVIATFKKASVGGLSIPILMNQYRQRRS